jgi:hypothetical protein
MQRELILSRETVPSSVWLEDEIRLGERGSIEERFWTFSEPSVSDDVVHVRGTRGALSLELCVCETDGEVAPIHVKKVEEALRGRDAYVVTYSFYEATRLRFSLVIRPEQIR